MYFCISYPDNGIQIIKICFIIDGERRSAFNRNYSVVFDLPWFGISDAEGEIPGVMLTGPYQEGALVVGHQQIFCALSLDAAMKPSVNGIL